MSLVKAIEHGKEHRKPYRGIKSFDWSCTNHGSCTYCMNNRLIQTRKIEEKAKDELKNDF